VIELIMFNRQMRAGAGQLLRRVNFAVPDNFRAVCRQRLSPEPTARGGSSAAAAVSNRYSTPVNIGWTWFYVLNKR
jgi:hypothetical protein